MTQDSNDSPIPYDFGTFEGCFWPTEFCYLEDTLSVSEIVRWRDSDRQNAEYWPTGDRPEMALLFSQHGLRATQNDLWTLSSLFDRLGGDTTENYLRVRHAVRTLDINVSALRPTMVAALVVHIAVAADAPTARRTIEAELRARYGLNGDPLKFVTDSADWQFEELQLGEKTAVIVAPRGKALSPRK